MIVDKVEVSVLSDSSSIVLVIKMPLVLNDKNCIIFNHVNVGRLLIWS